MKIDRVSYQKVYAVAAYVTERIGVEASIDEGQDPKFVLAELKKLCDEVNQANNPHLYANQKPNAVYPLTPDDVFTERLMQMPDINEEEIDPPSLINQMTTCTSPVVFKIYKNLVKTDEEKEFYDKKMEELLNQPITNGK